MRNSSMVTRLSTSIFKIGIPVIWLLLALRYPLCPSQNIRESLIDGEGTEYITNMFILDLKDFKCGCGSPHSVYSSWEIFVLHRVGYILVSEKFGNKHKRVFIMEISTPSLFEVALAVVFVGN